MALAEFLGEKLTNYVKSFPVQVNLLRLKERQGLVPARLIGAANATGDVLIFLDSHCECTEGWLEPLLSEVQSDYRRIACPVIDIISDNHFGYMKSFEFHWGAFNWNMLFR